MLDTASSGLQQGPQPTSLKYHIVRNGGSDYYLTTNPNQKHIHDPIGPSYYVRVSAASRVSRLKSNLAAKDSQDESDGSFSVIIFVHDYDNVSVSAHSNEDSEQPVKYNEQGGLLIPIMHIRRIDGESKMTVTVLDNGENIWETAVALHSDPYTGESKFVFLDPWDRRWSLEGKDGINCTSSLYDEPISNLERKLLADSKVGWITLESPALKMLDLMVGVNMAVFCFRNYELNPSRLTTIATGILHADLNTVKTSQTTTKKKKGGFRLNFTKKKESKSMGHSSHYNNAQTGNVIPGSISEHDRNQQNRTKREEPREQQQSALLQGDVMPDDRQPAVNKLQRRPAMRNKESLEEPLPAVLPAFAYQAPYPALPGFSVSVTKSDATVDGFVRGSYHEARSQSSSGYSTPSSIGRSASQPIYISPRVDDQKTPPIYAELQSQAQHQSGLETFTPPVRTGHRRDSRQTQSETNKPPVRTPSQLSIEHLVNRPASIPPRVEQQQTPPTEAGLQSQPLHHYPQIHAAAQSQVQHPIQIERLTPSLHPEQPRYQMSPELTIPPPHSPYDASARSGNKNVTAISLQCRHPLLESQRHCQQSAMLSSSSNSSASVASDDPRRRSMFSSSASASPAVSQGPRPRPNSMILPASTNANVNSTANQSHQYMSGGQPRRNDGRRVLQRGPPPQANTQTFSSTSKSSSGNKKNRLSMMAFVSKFQ
ncbi:hypothetical protein V1523DRAFT_401965 [Lipomyces doorenjongii]